MKNQPIRVLNLFTIMNRGGAETMCMNLYRNIDRSKVQFDFLVYYAEKGAYDDEIESLGGKIFRIAHLDFAHLADHIRDANRFFFEHPEYSIVHDHMGENGALICRAARKAGVKTIIYHSHAQKEPLFDRQPRILMRHLVNNVLYRIARKNCTDYFACGSKAAAFFDKEVSKVHILHNAVNLQKFAFDSVVRMKKREKLSCSEHFVIGNVARFEPCKNQLFLLEVFREIIQHLPSARLWLIGDGNMAQIIRERIALYQLEDKVILWGIRNDVHEMLQAMDVFVFPSTREGLPVACIEAQASGLPCVFSEGFDHETAITKNCRILSLQDSVEKWTKTILSFKDFERKDTCDEIRAAGYDIAETSKKMESLYLDMANR